MGQRFGMSIVVLVGLVSLLLSTVWGRQGIVKTRQGQTISGEITEKPDSVVVDVRGIQMEVRRADITSMVFPGDLDEQYRERLSKLEDGDVAGRLSLARWAFDAHRYDLARDAADKALVIDPNSRDAMDFLQLIRQQQQLEQSTGQGPSPTGAQTGSGAGDQTAKNTDAPAKSLLSPDQVNIIKQFELREKDNAIRVSFANDVRQRFIRAYNKDARQFMALRPIDQALMILEEADPKFHGDVKIQNDPAPLAEYRRFIEPMVLRNCATSQCHAPGNNTGFTLFNDSSEAGSYTNFYILSRYSRTVEAPASGFGSGPVVRKMIDRNQPELSLLVQYGLPQDVADARHPTVTGMRSMFRGKTDSRYRQTIDWMRTLRPMEPNYGIDYQLPARPATQPTTRP